MRGARRTGLAIFHPTTTTAVPRAAAEQSRQQPMYSALGRRPAGFAGTDSEDPRISANWPAASWAAKSDFFFHRARCILFFKKAGSPAATQRSGCGGEEESGEAPPAAEKASRFRGSGAIGGPEGAGNRNAATVCKGATERYEGCPPPQGVPNIAQFDPTTNGGRILPGTGTPRAHGKREIPREGPRKAIGLRRSIPRPGTGRISAPREGENAAPPRRGNTNSSRAGKGAKTRNFGGTDIEL